MRKIALIASFAALAVALGFMFLAVPNFELVTSTFFLAGYFLGARAGVISAVLGEFVYSLLNPLGSAAPPLMIAQILGMGIIACCGSLAARRTIGKSEKNRGSRTESHLNQLLYFGLFGLMLTIIFDVMTTISFLLFSGLSFTKFIASLLYGMYFYLIHIGMNTAIFALLLPVIIPIIKNKLPHFESR